jgi:phosphate transport system substrate-binding protein
MPRNGKLARIVLVLGAAALVGSLAAGAASAAHKGHKLHLRHYGGTINGAGSSLVGPAWSIWAPAYKAKTGTTVNYASVGSGAGIAQISARTVDFGASDAPFTPEQAAGCKVNGVGCLNIPWALAATGPVVNIPGVATGQLHLTGAVLANIYLGNITNWSNSAITKLNPNLKLPNLAIHVVYRSDGSGDTYAFTNYLSKVSKQWKSKVGYATTVSWPTGVGGSHNDGVAAIVGSTPGSIGYVSTAYVIANHLRMPKMKNASGRYVLPTVRTILNAAKLVNAKQLTKLVKNDFTGGLSITNPPKTKNHKFRDAWPIATFTYVLLPKTTAKAAQLKQLIKWVLQPAQQNSIKKYVFAPMPTGVVNAAYKVLTKIKS